MILPVQDSLCKADFEHIMAMQVRYTSVRRQTAPKEGEPELQVLDYQNVANDLLPLVASAYALIFMVCTQLSEFSI